ncbi:MAG: TauD/TfdA family dioxygenase [Gammaproteobacteria bacterium]|nr:TauD/TfdA family dioxygenase [Gammaproteobacteria bacterium]
MPDAVIVAENLRFGPKYSREYRVWRDAKLRARDGTRIAAMVEIRDPLQLGAGELAALKHQLACHNLAFYCCARDVDAGTMCALGRQLGLRRLDHHLCADRSGIATIADGSTPGSGEFIPYTTRALNWHTDGYYVPVMRSVRAFVLHCVEAAVDGGANRFYDHELAYIMLREREPLWIDALSQRDVLTIPGYAVDSGVSRPDISGPVFSVRSDGGLHMRYTARTRHVVWKRDTAVQEAIGFLHEILDDPDGYGCRHTLRAGEGVVCANVLHSRDAYVDNQPVQRRKLLRARYRDPLDVH